MSDLAAQVPTPETTGKPPSAASSPTPSAQDPVRRRSSRRGNRRGGRRSLTIIEAGTIHPVSGPPIQNGVVVIRGERILAVGQQGDLRLPPNSKVYKFPDGHVYPGLIDASTDAFTDANLRADKQLNGGSKIADGLVWTDSRDDHLIEHGITTAYVTVRTTSSVRGQGAIVRPRTDGFELWEDDEPTALQLRMTNGPGASHALQRQAQLAFAGRLFESLEKYQEANEKYEKDLEKYETEFEKYLDYHKKKSGKDKKGGDSKKGDDKPKAEKPASQAPTLGPGDGRRRGGRRGEGRPPRKDRPEQMDAETFEKTLATIMALVGKPAPQATSQEGASATASAQDPKPQGRPTRGPSNSGAKKPASKSTKKSDGPERPKFPKKPKADPQKEALLKVLDGDMPLRVEAHRVDELLAALRLQREEEIPLLVLEQAYGADRITREIAEQGATVVLTNLLPNSLATPGDKRNPYSKFDPTALPQKLDDAGIPFAIASGAARLASLLPMMAAAAIGRGLSEDAALRSITLTPAEILGISKDTGSLTREKFADVIVTDGPLFRSDSRVLLVVAKGRTEYEAN